MNWDDVQRQYYYRLMADGKLHFFVREKRMPMRVRELEILAHAESADRMDELITRLNEEECETTKI